MKSASVDQLIGELCAGQWGMFTAAQARARGIERSNLAHRESDGRLERLQHGVYRLAGSSATPIDDLRAAWLSTNPSALAYERTLNPDVIVGVAAAASVHGIGDIDPEPYKFFVKGRRQTQKGEIVYSQRAVESLDIAVRDGLPVTSIERTIADLLRDFGDISLVADALSDAIRRRGVIDEDRLAVLLSPLAGRYGHKDRDGQALLDQLLAAAAQDAASKALEALRNPVLVAGIQSMLKNQQRIIGQMVAAAATIKYPVVTFSPDVIRAIRKAAEPLPLRVVAPKMPVITLPKSPYFTTPKLPTVISPTLVGVAMAAQARAEAQMAQLPRYSPVDEALDQIAALAAAASEQSTSPGERSVDTASEKPERRNHRPWSAEPDPRGPRGSPSPFGADYHRGSGVPAPHSAVPHLRLRHDRHRRSDG